MIGKENGNEFVVRDPWVIGDLGASVSLGIVDRILRELDASSHELRPLNSKLADVVCALSDFLQAYVAHATGVDVRRVGVDGCFSSPVDTALEALANVSLQGKLSTVSKSQTNHQLRNQLQTISTAINLLRQEVESTDKSDEAKRLFDEIQSSIRKIAETPESEALRQSNSGTVILVEDNESEREMLLQFLTRNGFSVKAFEDGEEALEFIFANRPKGSVLLDMGLPKCDGASTVRRIREHKEFDSMPIIGMSGSSLSEAAVEIGSNGINNWFRKPFNPSALVDLLSQSN